MFFNLACNDDNHKISNEFKIRLVQSTDCGFCASGKNLLSFNGKNVVAKFALSCLIGSSLFLQVLRTFIKAWTS